MTPVNLNILDNNTHSYVGLDLSTHSCGLSYVDGSQVYAEVFDPSKNLDNSDVYYDGQLRMKLKEKMLEFINERQPEFVVLEDVFNGHTAKVYRQLMNLNNILDELILNGDVSTEMVRVNNRVWKSWLMSQVPESSVKYLTDKLKVEISLAYYGLTRDMVDYKGYQDELDAIGMAVGHYLHNFYDPEVMAEVEFAKVSGDNFTKNQLLNMVAFSQNCPVGLNAATRNTSEATRAVSRGLLDFLRWSYDTLLNTGERCLKYENVPTGTLSKDLKLTPTYPPSDLYIFYKEN